MQNTLFGKKREPVELKESYGGFEVCNPEHIDYKDVTPKLVRSGKEIVKKYPSYEIAKEEFEKEVRRDYESDVVWKKSKFQDCQGHFWLNGVKINWELRTHYITEYHFEFNSENKTPNLLTETGYLSDFSMNLDCYNSVEEYIKDLLNYKINCDEKGTPKKRLIEYKLDWTKNNYIPSKQFTLIELEGGKK